MNEKCANCGKEIPDYFVKRFPELHVNQLVSDSREEEDLFFCSYTCKAEWEHESEVNC